MKLPFGILILCLLAACQPPVSQPVHQQSYRMLNGEEQYVEITGSSADLPVLLFLHGGPGWSQTPSLRYFNQALTDSVLLVAWDQSGAGKSFLHNPDPQHMSLEQLVEDAHALTQQLQQEFHQEKIFLAGFSFGSKIGVLLIERYPDDYAAYLGISQVISLDSSRMLSREWIREQAIARADTSAIRLLDRLEAGDTSLCQSSHECFLVQHQLLSSYDGTLYEPSFMDSLEKAETFYEDYSGYDWYAGYRRVSSSINAAGPDPDFFSVRELKVPLYFLHGRHDHNIPGEVTEKFLKDLSAPHKELIWFEKSGHELSSEEPDRFMKETMRILRRHLPQT